MLAWEEYFRQNTLADTRALAKSLDREVSDEGEVLRREIGDKHSDVLSLTQRIESLKLLVNRQESDLANFASAPGKHVPRAATAWRSEGLGEDHITNIVTARLLSLIDRSIVQRKYVSAARALYLAQSLEIPEASTRAVATKLENRLDAWLSTGTQVSQNMLHACMIVRRWSAITFVARFLMARLSRVRRVLSEDRDMIAAFKLIDSTLFIHHQLVSDLCKSRLSQRRITEMSEFLGQALLVEHVRAHPQAGTIRAFPAECYEASGETVANTDFLQAVADEVQLTATRLFNGMEDVNELTSALSKFVMQVQNSLSIESGMGRLLDACEPPFSAKFEDYLNVATHLPAAASPDSIEAWKGHISGLRTEQAHIARLARTTSKIAPAFSERLAALQSRTSDQVEANCMASYARGRKHILDQPVETLEQARSTVETVAILDSTYASLGGAVAGPPNTQYEQLAKFIIERWQAQPRRDCHGASVPGVLFELLLVMDSALQDATWMPSVLKTLRPLVLDHVREVAPELLEVTEQAFLDKGARPAKTTESSNNTHARSQLLLRPLVT